MIYDRSEHRQRIEKIDFVVTALITKSFETYVNNIFYIYTQVDNIYIHTQALSAVHSVCVRSSRYFIGKIKELSYTSLDFCCKFG